MGFMLLSNGDSPPLQNIPSGNALPGRRWRRDESTAAMALDGRAFRRYPSSSFSSTIGPSPIKSSPPQIWSRRICRELLAGIGGFQGPHTASHPRGRRGLDGSRDLSVDSSLESIFLFGAFDPRDELVEGTMKAVTEGLLANTSVGDLSRYQTDEYRMVPMRRPGNPLTICTLWLAR